MEIRLVYRCFVKTGRKFGATRFALRRLTPHYISVPVHQSVILPKFEAGPDTRCVHPARGVDCLSIVLMLDMLRQIDVVSVIDKVHAVKGHRA